MVLVNICTLPAPGDLHFLKEITPNEMDPDNHQEKKQPKQSQSIIMLSYINITSSS